MGLRFGEKGVVKGPLELEYSWKKLALYALSVGATVEEELEYVYEKNMKILPTFWASILGLKEFTDIYEYGQYIPTTLHYGFEIVFHKELKATEGKIKYTVEITDIFDRGEKRGSLAVIKSEAFDESGEKVFTLITKDVDLSTGGFGGLKPENAKVSFPDREADYKILDCIDSTHVAMYRIDNDPNILHIDPEFAKLGGYNAPIVMGMCIAGFACRALVKVLCPQNPEKIHKLNIRFTNILEMNSDIETKIWKIDNKKALFKVENSKSGDTVLDYCTVELL